MFTVNLWCSKPGTNDDCWTGSDYTDEAAARAAYADPTTMSEYIARTIAASDGELWLELDGPGVHEERQLRAADPAALERARREERHEQAMEAGMGLGVEAYNDVMGWGS